MQSKFFSLSNHAGSSSARRVTMRYWNIFWVAGLCVFVASMAAAQSVSFSHTATLTVGSGPQGIATADFNGDGNADLVVVNSFDNTVSVLFGNGDGTFQPAVNYPTGSDNYPFAVTVGDFNGDGKIDVAYTNVGNAIRNNLAVLLNNGHGTFTAAPSYNLGTYPASLIAADFDHDGKSDIAVPDVYDQNVSVFLANSDGTFQPAIVTAVTVDPYAPAVGDFDGDGKLDLAVGSVYDNNVTVLLGKGTGAFQPPVTYPVGNSSNVMAVYAPVVADFNGDGRLDIGTGNRGNPGASVLLGNGDGTFQSALDYYQLLDLVWPGAAADFNGDGKIDLVVAYGDAHDAISVVLGDGGGNFQPGVDISTGSQPESLTVADFDHDGRPDVAVALHGDNTVWIMINTSSTKAVMTSPTPGSTLPGDTVTFVWSPSVPASTYQVDIGSVPGGIQYYHSGNLGNVLTVTASGLPVDGSPVYVTLWSFLNGQWVNNQYTYTAFKQTSSLGVITSPPSGSIFTDTTVTFIWSPGSNATGYKLYVGKTPGGKQYYGSGNLGNVLTVTVKNLPSNASTVYVTLYSLVQGKWLSNSYTYSAWNAATGQAVLVTPSPGSQFIDATETFIWTSGKEATGYKIDIGSTPGGRDYYHSRILNNLNITVSNLPTDGSVVYVTLYTQINGKWYSTTYPYTAWNVAMAQAQMVTPPPGSQFDSPTVTFIWISGMGATAYRLDIGKTPNGHQYYQSGNLNVLTTTVSSLPTDGSTVYVTLYTQLNATWYSKAYTYRAFKPKPLGFKPAVSYSAGNFAHAVATGDFNHDGYLDLAVVIANDNTVGIMLGKGDGTFKAAVTYATGKYPWSVVVGDFNRDGKLDLATANQDGNNVSVLLGNGNGTFRTAVNYSVGSNPWDVTVGDFDGDGKLDLAVANENSNNVSLLLGNGDGTFRAAVNYSVGKQPWSLNVGDFDGDGNLDIVVPGTSSNDVSVLLGNGDGTFQPAVKYAAGSGPDWAGVGVLTAMENPTWR